MNSQLIRAMVCVICGGCASHEGVATATLAQDLRRDTAKAARLTQQGCAYIDDTNWDKAEAALLNALDADVMYGPAHNDLGTVYWNQHKLYEAAREFQYADKLMPYRPEPKDNLGMVMEAAGKYDDAIGWYDQAMTIAPDNPQYVGNAARVRIRRGDRDAKVRDLLAKVASVDPRADWENWAKEKLIVIEHAPTTESGTIP